MERDSVIIRVLDFSEETEQEALYDLRWRVLRDPLGLARGTERIAADYEPGTVHLGAFDAESRLIGCSSLIPADTGLQLRAMAVDPIWQGTGIGAAILKTAANVAREREVSLWCEARAHAVDFYKRSGWAVESDVFEVPRIGPHFRMRLITSSSS